MKLWNEKTEEELRRLWREGYSSTAIARAFNTGLHSSRARLTAASIRGKASRMGLPMRELATRQNTHHRLARVKISGVSTDRPCFRLTDPDAGVSLTDIKSGQCRWPVGDTRTPEFRFCGRETVPGKSYCADHFARSIDAGATARAQKNAKSAAAAARRTGDA